MRHITMLQNGVIDGAWPRGKNQLGIWQNGRTCQRAWRGGPTPSTEEGPLLQKIASLSF